MATGGVYPKVTGDLIYQADYNSLQIDTSLVVSTYYQNAVAASSLSGSVAISATQFDNLRTDINKAYKHITGSDSTITDVASGGVISHTVLNEYKTAVDYILANYQSVYAPTQLSSAIDSSSMTAAWNGSHTWTRRMTWASSALADAYFNTGGYIVVDVSGANATAAVKDQDWLGILNTIPTQTYAYGNWFSGFTLTYQQGSVGTTYYGNNYATITCTKVNATTLDISVNVVDGEGTHIDNFGQTVPDYDVNTDVNASITRYYSIDAITAPTTTVTTTSNF